MITQTYPLGPHNRYAIIYWRSKQGNNFATIRPCGEGDTVPMIKAEWAQSGKCVIGVEFIQPLEEEG